MRSFGIHGSAQLWRAEGYKRSPSVAGPIEGLEGEPPLWVGALILPAFVGIAALIGVIVS